MRRYDKVKEVYDDVIDGITQNKEAWMKFLDFQGKLYKHNFDDTLLIYSQRPNATFVADMKTWNKVGRWIKKGSKSIPVFDEKKIYPTLKNYFDIEDTVLRTETRWSYPSYWTVDEDSREVIINRITTDSSNKIFENYIGSRIDSLLSDDEMMFNDFKVFIKDSQVENLDLEKVKNQFKNMIKESSYYLINRRCGINTAPEFKVISYFDKKPLIIKMGSIISEISGSILKDIEREVKLLETVRSESNENSLQRNNGNGANISRANTDSRESEYRDREIRNDGATVSKGDTSPSVQLAKIGRDIDSDDESSKRRITPENGSDSRRNIKENGNNKSNEFLRELQTQGNDQSVGRRDSSKGNSIQNKIEKSEGELPLKGSFFSLSKIDIKEIVKTEILKGSGFVGGKERIVDFFLKEENSKLRADFLKKEYGTGGGTISYKTGDGNKFIGHSMHDSKGIEINLDDGKNIKLSWSKVAEKIDALIKSREYFETNYKGDIPEILEEQQISLFDTPLKPEKKKIVTIENRNYKKLEKVISGILDGRYNYLKLKSKGFMDLSVERIYDNRISIMHYYIQNGDLMRDPDIEIIIDDESKSLIPVTFRQDNMGVFKDIESQKNKFKLRKELSDFLNTWLNNIENQNYKPVLAHLREYGNEVVEFDEDGKEIIHDEKISVKDKVAKESIDEIKIEKEIKSGKINYQYKDEDQIGLGGEKGKYKQNIEAIKTLKNIEEENRLAISNEQSILAKYNGWGGIASAFDQKNSKWTNEYHELKNLLSKDEYISARESTPNAHYTPAVLIKAMYKAFENLGFESGKILEPSMGIGNFFSHLPESMKTSKLHGIELDDITGRIARQLYQDADIKIKGYEKVEIKDDTFDIAIGNVPFGSYKVYDREYNKQNFYIHDYFFAKTIDKVRTGGVVALVTSKFTLDKKGYKLRKYLAERAELLGAIRLPKMTFKGTAGTEVTTDILFLQKRDRRSVENPNWLNITKTEDGVPVNQYFLDNPHMMLGTMRFDETIYGKDSNYTSCFNDDENFNLEESLNEAIEK